MDNKLTNQEIAKVFAMYIGCALYIRPYGTIHKAKLSGVLPDKIFAQADGDKAPSFYYTEKCECKLLLKTSYSITDEDAIQVAKFQGWIINEDNLKNVSWSLQNEFFEIDYTTYQYLISKGYAVPLWFGVDHWANGKTAIELGIAIEPNK